MMERYLAIKICYYISVILNSFAIFQGKKMDMFVG